MTVTAPRPLHWRLAGASHVECYKDLLTNKWGWSCACGAESRYLYSAPSKVERLATVHARYCDGERRPKVAR